MPAQQPPDADAAAFWRRHDAVRTAAPLRVRFAALRTRFPELVPRLAGLGPVAWYAMDGVGFAGGPGAATAATAISAAREALLAGGGWLVVEESPDELRAQVDPWGPRPAGFRTMQMLKQRFDPDRRLNPGRYVGGL